MYFSRKGAAYDRSTNKELEGKGEVDGVEEGESFVRGEVGVEVGHGHSDRQYDSLQEV